MSKYGARKTTIDNIKFDSVAESRYYVQLTLRKRAREIEDFELQPSFVLIPKFKKNGRTYRETRYVADFRVVYPDGRVEIIDVKSKPTKTRLYEIKKKLFELNYPELTITEVIG
jgi:hypothetical protein